MVASYTSRLRLVKQGDGDNPNTWGTVLNDGMISLVDDAIAGYTTTNVANTESWNGTSLTELADLGTARVQFGS